MANTRESNLTSVPSPRPPTEAELVSWRSLSREEQIARYRQVLHHPDCDQISDATMADILTLARKRVAARGHG